MQHLTKGFGSDFLNHCRQTFSKLERYPWAERKRDHPVWSFSLRVVCLNHRDCPENHTKFDSFLSFKKFSPYFSWM